MILNATSNKPEDWLPVDDDYFGDVMTINTEYDASWDEGNHVLYDAMLTEWKNRDWYEYLVVNLTFPFPAIRLEDNSGQFSTKRDVPFGQGHTVEVKDIQMEDDLRGLIVSVKEGREKGHLPLCELEVTAKDHPCYWPLREYVVWFANR
ncbi:calcium-binding protein [Endozoicomonas sp.]|uniref:calcium-binding protein n=1 Tax=Endozoicomonas sp. TaxID=1892382 RepID=UPI003AF91436